MAAPFWATFVIAALLIFGVTFWLVHATFVAPLRIIHPEASRWRLWAGWWAAWLTGMAIFTGLLATIWVVLPGQNFKIGF